MNKYWSLVLLVLFATSCTAQTVKISVLDDSSCELPCWHGIVPGKSKKQDVLLTLPNLSNIDQTSITIYNPKLVMPEGTPDQAYDEIINALFTFDRQQQNSISIFLIAETVSVLSFQLYADEVLLSDAIEKFGEPQYIIITPYRENFVVGFVSPSTGVAFVYSTVGKSKKQLYEIYPEISLGSVYLFDKEAYKQFLELRSLTLGERGAQDTSQHLVPWVDYSELNQYIKQP